MNELSDHNTTPFGPGARASLRVGHRQRIADTARTGASHAGKHAELGEVESREMDRCCAGYPDESIAEWHARLGLDEE
ncbi:hypothetical protein RSO41_05020 [Halomonas sp. I1]|uniref:hypothetical protein n=1 Tax=Halomonas sp. I1 TaxID=393536 RepID=UPI0028DFBAA5|nr:hypothetical protein [Halomonas sp. I1]MDT8894008.1 hypothetical protein [Halomonas sp. I1]